MFELVKEGKIEIIEKKSRFITRSFKVTAEEQVKAILEKIKKEEKGARHNCYAWRILKPNQQIYIKRSDDGEPGGTAGAPMLAQLVGENLVNILVVTTRYFGGIKLGTGGLASMYKKGVAEIIKDCGKKLYVIKNPYLIQAIINKADHLLDLLNKNQITIIDKEFSDRIKVTIAIPEADLEKINQICKQVRDELTSLTD